MNEGIIAALTHPVKRDDKRQQSPHSKGLRFLAFEVQNLAGYFLKLKSSSPSPFIDATIELEPCHTR
jgi:hypothetical protein